MRTIGLEKVPNLIIPGFPKSGTSSLHEYLNLHPKILMSTIKEPHIYSKLNHYEQRFNKDFNFSFNNLFPDLSNDFMYLGESSTSYLINKKTPELIVKDNPKVKFIVLARDPIERIVSHYNWLNSFPNIVNLSFKEEIEKWDKIPFDINNHCGIGYKYYLESSKYGEQLNRFLEYFDISQFLFISSESLKKNPQQTVNDCFHFLGLPLLKEIVSIERNKTTFNKKPMFNSTLLNQFKRLLPNAPKNTLKKLILNYSNTYKNKTYLPTDIEIEWLKEKLSSDVILFKKLSNMDIKDWKHFN